MSEFELLRDKVLSYGLAFMSIDVLPLVYNALESEHTVVGRSMLTFCNCYDNFYSGARTCIESRA